MNRGRFLKFVEAVEAILADNGIVGEPAEEITLTLFTDLFTAIWDGSSAIRGRYKTKKDFILAVKTEIKTRSLVRTRYERDPVI